VSEPAHSSGGVGPVVLDGGSLTLEDLARVARDPRVRLEIAEEALVRVRESREQIERLTARYREDFDRWRGGEDVRPVFEYGVTTGFGEFKNIPVAPEELEQLQRNLLLSHAVGTGTSADPDDEAGFYEADVMRAVLVIRLNAFLKGHSGVRPELARTLQAMVNRGIVPRVPIHGSVGSSGDLAPLSHTFVVLLGEGSWSVVRAPGDLGRRPRELRRGLESLTEDLGMEPAQPSYKEGLALNNGTTFSTALLALAVHDAERAAHTADVSCSLSLEAACGAARAFDPRVHEARGHAGQIASAANIRGQVKGSRLVERAGAVQDVYSLRCAPTVHGAARDAIAYARRVAEVELNAATDNPLFFPADATDPWDYEFRGNWPEGYRGDQRAGYSAGNFHGEPIGMAADFLAIGVAELANIAERRVQMLLDSRQSRCLPSNLIPRRGVNSGFMLIQYTAASLVSENKVLTHPASVDSIPTSANSEDHNAMSTIAARKLRTVLRNVQAVLAIELLVAAQAVEWRVAMQRDPRGKGEDDGGDLLRDRWEKAERESQDFAERTAPERRPDIAAALGEGTRRAYLAIRDLAGPMLVDRTLDEDIRAVRVAVEQGRI
jgi:histidine ammonia-lyase